MEYKVKLLDEKGEVVCVTSYGKLLQRAIEAFRAYTEEGKSAALIFE